MGQDNSFEEGFDLKQVLDDEGIDYKENASHVVLGECPECDGRDKLFVDKRSKLWICYKCVDSTDGSSGKGNLWTFLLAIGFDERQVRNLFKGKRYERYVDDFSFVKMEADSVRLGCDDEDKKELLDGEISAWRIPNYLIELDLSEFQLKQFREAYLYLWRRYVRSPWQYKAFRLHYDSRRKRVVFPATTVEGKVVGSQSRDITERWREEHPKCQNSECDLRWHYYFKGEEEAPKICPSCSSEVKDTFYPKSTNTLDFPKTEIFFNENSVDFSKPVTLVEGPFDSINVPNSMAFLGKTLSENQLSKLLKNLNAPLILYLDGDSAGTNSTRDIFEQVRHAVEDVKIVHLKDGEDPGSFSVEQNLDKINGALRPSEWFQLKGLIYL